ncbi:MAG: DNA polymerase III subunit delta' [Alphaproteobacteria bacterium]
MAKAAAVPVIEPPDRIEGVALPRANPLLIGHDTARSTFARALASGRMHHAWLLTGPPGIGKATFAFHMAKALLSRAAPGEGDFAPVEGHAGVGKITAGAHPNLLHMHRQWIARDKRYRTELTVDAVRRIIPFFGMTAGEAGWRIVIVDTADEMNRNAANALLKALEEPPALTLFFLVTSKPDGLLPTIRSRCRKLPLFALGPDDLRAVLAALDIDPGSGGDGNTVLALAEGSPRRAIELIRRDGLGLHKSLAGFFSPTGNLQTTPELVAFARTAADTKTGAFGRFVDFYFGYLHRRIHGEAEPGSVSGRALQTPELALVRWAGLWDKAASGLRDVETFNLDRSQFVLELMETTRTAIGKAARSQI